MEAAASPSPPPSRASPLRLNPAAFLLRTTTTTTVQPTTSADAPPPPPPTRQTAGVDRLISFLSSLIPRRGQRAKQPTSPPPTAAIYRSMCIFGLKTILIPYRTNLVRLQTGPNYADAFADFVKRVASSSGRPTGSDKQRM
ncbi:hypothetical protein EE612_041134 [Oryza sativa]|nr:hypothetical protein EE612_041134 [Oryza sativa]